MEPFAQRCCWLLKAFISTGSSAGATWPGILFQGDRASVDYRGREGGYRIGYARSRNLVDWERADEEAGIDVSEGEAWDYETIRYPHVFTLDGEIYMAYLGHQVGRYGFGLAVLEGDLR